MKPIERLTQEQNTPSLAEAALHYARMGFPVFPLSGKVPYKGTHGYRDATTNLVAVETMWSEHPSANIGLPTGETSGVIVLDMDVPEGYFNIKELQQKYGKLPETRRVRTAGGGLHYYFQYPRDGNRYPGTVGLDQYIGVDVRSEGNYVVIPPSRLYGRKFYTWNNQEQEIAQAPVWLLTLLSQAEDQRHIFQQGLGFAYPASEKWLREAIAKAKEGNRNAVGFWLARMLRNDGRSETEAIHSILAYANRVPQGDRPAYTSKEAVASVRSAYSRPAQERPRRI